VFSTALRNIDAVLGNDDKIVCEICTAAESIESELIAVVGTPVPAITGMDNRGIAAEIGQKTGRPALGFNTTGFSYYDRGIVQAGKELIKRFAEPSEKIPGTVNILGMTPIDFGINGNDEDIVSLLEGAGLRVTGRFFMGLTVEQIRRCASAEMNVAVSSAGLELAKYMKKRFGTPCVAGFPIGLRHARAFADFIKGSAVCSKPEKKKGKDLLIVSDQVVGCSLRQALYMAGVRSGIAVASFFVWDEDLAEEGDVRLGNEAEYIKLLKTGRWQALAADPMLRSAPPAEGMSFLSLVHPAVSGKLSWEKTPRYIGADFENTLEEIAGLLYT